MLKTFFLLFKQNFSNIFDFWSVLKSKFHHTIAVLFSNVEIARLLQNFIIIDKFSKYFDKGIIFLQYYLNISVLYGQGFINMT